MTHAKIQIKEEDIIRLTLEFLDNRDLNISQLSLERETGIINGKYSDDILFLRQLILDGQWDDVIEFIQPLEEALQLFDIKKFKYAILRHKYIELICIKSEAANELVTVDGAVEEVVEVLSELEKLAPSKEEYSQLCLLLTIPRLVDHLEYKNWNPSTARVQCFREIYPLVEKFLPTNEKKLEQMNQKATKNDRLMQLIIKGILYESCVNFCQIKATGGGSDTEGINFGKMLDGSIGFGDSDLSLLSWLQSINPETFQVPFEQKTLNVDIERLDRPTLETSWTEHIAINPVKPNKFPHSVMPFTRPKSAADIMSRSLLPSLDGCSVLNAKKNENIQMTKSSFASFHLTGIKTSAGKLMSASVDKLFATDGETMNGSIATSTLPAIQEVARIPTPEKINYKIKSEAVLSNNTSGQESPTTTVSTAKTSRRDSLNEKVTTAFQQPLEEFSSVNQTLTTNGGSCKDVSTNSRVNNGRGQLLEQYQKQKLNKEIFYENSRDSTDTSDKNGAKKKTETTMANEGNRPRFIKVTTLEDVQAVRCAEFHPNGQFYAVGSNSKTFRICEYPSLSDFREENAIGQPTVLFKRTKHHKGSIYCMAWSPQGDLIATGSNDKTVKLMRFNENQKQLEGQEIELTMHDGTIRDLCFLEDISNKSSLLISGGAGDCKIYVTDCETSTPFQALSGHGGHILSLYNWGGVMFISGSQDKTVRFWDLRTRGCVNMVTPITSPGSRQGSVVASVCVDPSGRLLVSGHEDSSCVLFDIRGNRPIQCFKPHSADVRSIRFSPSAYYLLTGGYDNKLVLTDLQGDLTMPLPSVVVAEHSDKVISGRWHPTDFSFISNSADKTAVLWALPPI